MASRTMVKSKTKKQSNFLLSIHDIIVLQCSSDCNRGEQIRRVICINRRSSQPVDDRYCIPHRPVTRIDCYGFSKFILDE